LKFGQDGLQLATVLINTMSGVPLIYTGEEIPNDKKLSLFEKVNVNWAQPRKMQSLYHTLFQLRNEHKALSRGQMVRVTSPDSVYAFVRVAGTDRILSVLNFGTRALAASLQLPIERIFPGKKQVIIEDVFTRSRTTIASDELKQMQVELGPRGYAVFVIR
jgi:glycosidase